MSTWRTNLRSSMEPCDLLNYTVESDQGFIEYKKTRSGSLARRIQRSWITVDVGSLLFCLSTVPERFRNGAGSVLESRRFGTVPERFQNGSGTKQQRRGPTQIAIREKQAGVRAHRLKRAARCGSLQFLQTHLWAYFRASEHGGRLVWGRSAFSNTPSLKYDSKSTLGQH